MLNRDSDFRLDSFFDHFAMGSMIRSMFWDYLRQSHRISVVLRLKIYVQVYVRYLNIDTNTEFGLI